jgi:hypothetical protein
LLIARLVALGCLLGWAALLGTPALEPVPRALGGSSLLELRSLTGAAVFAARALMQAALLALRFAPLGFFAVFVLPDQAGRLSRAGLVAVPALVLASVAARLALAARAGSAPGAFEILVPGLGLLVGAWAGLAWRRGWRARLMFLPTLVANALVLLLVGFGLAVLSLDAEPALEEPKPLTSAEKRHIVELFQGKNPRKLPPGEVRTLRLNGSELDQLTSWAALATGRGVRTRVQPVASGVAASVSVPVPRTGRWWNVRAAARVGIEKGRLAGTGTELRVGQFQAPSLLLGVVSPFLVVGLQGDRDLRSVLPAVESLSFSPEAATLRYTRVDMPPGLVARLVWGEGAGEATRETVYAHVDRLLATLATTPAGDARFARALETAFAAARERGAVSGGPAAENRAAILALGIVLGHPRLARSVGERLDDERSGAALDLLAGTTLRRRGDWARHFTVSAALTALAAASPSDAAGLLKEELDADGGSGFSFGDLLADRAGTSFADSATRDDASALRMQQRLAGGFRVDDFFPPAADLPEGIADAELQARYGGVGGALYRQKAEEIERRLAACAAYRESAPPAEAPPSGGPVVK